MMRVFAITFAQIRFGLKSFFDLRVRGAFYAPRLSAHGGNPPRSPPTHRFRGDGLHKVHCRRLLGNGETDQNLSTAPCLLLPTPRYLLNPRPVPGVTANLKLATQQGNALSHAGKPK